MAKTKKKEVKMTSMEVLQKRTKEYPAQIKSLMDITSMEIDKPADLLKAGDILIQIRKKDREIDSERKEMVNPLNAEVKQINNAYNVFIDVLDKADNELANKILNYIFNERVKAGTEYNQKSSALQLEYNKECEKARNEGKIPPPPVSLPAPMFDDSFRTPHGKLTISERDDFEVINIAEVPLEFHTIDLKKVKKSLEANIEIPGIRRVKKSILVVT